MRYPSSLAALLLFCLAVSSAWAQKPIQSPPAGTPVPGEVIVKFQKKFTPETLTDKGLVYHGISADLELKETLSGLAGIHLFSYDDVAMGEEMLLRALNDLPFVEAAQLNHYVEERATPNDPQFGSQWHHIDASDNDIDSDLAWDITTGRQHSQRRPHRGGRPRGWWLQLQPRGPHRQPLGEQRGNSWQRH